MRPSAALVALALLAACSGDDGGAAPATTTTPPTTTTTTAPSSSTTDTTATATGPYAGTANWICHPDLDADECDDPTTTVVAIDGSTTVRADAPAAEPTFDCFYAYPTTSTDPDINSDLQPDASERDTVRAQVGRFSTACRVFAPVYRSITLNGLGRGGFGNEARDIAYGDVRDAWRTYVEHLGEGRPVAIIGHSQGAGHLARLLEEEIRPDPDVDALLLAAVLLGSSVHDERPCTSTDPSERGCVISYSSYPADLPPVDGAIFGRDGAICVDPNALLGDDGDDLADVTLPATATLLGAVEQVADVETPFLTLPGAVRIACATSGTYSYLAVSLPGTEDARAVDRLLEQRLGPTWGLHLFDAQYAQDELIEVLSRLATSR